MASLSPFASDEEIKATFSPLERRFYKWGVEENNIDIISTRQRQEGRHLMSQAIEATFPDIDDPIEEFCKFSDKWFGRIQRRMETPVLRAEIIRQIMSTNCKDLVSLGVTVGMLTMRNCEDILLGESDFGGSNMGYALTINAHLLFPDIPHDKTSRPENPLLLDRAVLGLDIDINAMGHAQRASESRPGPSRRRRDQGSSSGEGSSDSIRSANSDDFLDRAPFCFLQLGHLVCCTGDDWRNLDSDSEIAWKSTGYSVVMHVDAQGIPTGNVYAIFDFHLPIYDDTTGNENLWKEIEWKDSTQTELPHIRCLYTDCDKQFFLAKIKTKFSNLGRASKFAFQVIRERRVNVARVKAEGPWGNLILNDIIDSVAERG